MVHVTGVVFRVSLAIKLGRRSWRRPAVALSSMVLVSALVSGAQSPPVLTSAVAGQPPSAYPARTGTMVLDDTAESYEAQHTGVQVHPAPVAPVEGSEATPQALLTPAALLELPSGPLGIPGSVLTAYHTAADELATLMPGCHMSWNLLAGIGRIESGHAHGGRVDVHGTTLSPILGPVLDGSNPGDGVVVTTRGGNATFDRAEGPMQFLLSTWSTYGADGNHDGVTDINNVYDAALGAGRYLCSGGLDVADPAQARAAVFRYNHSDAYVTNVLSWAAAYATGVQPTASEPGPIPPVTTPAPTKPTTTPAPPSASPAQATTTAPAPASTTAAAPASTTAPASKTATPTTSPTSATSTNPAPSDSAAPPPATSSPLIKLP